MSTTTAPDPRTQPIRYFAPAPLAAAKVDAATGIMRDVAIMSIGDAMGHDAYVDMTTLQQLFELCQGRSVKAFINHAWSPDPTDVIGLFSGLYIDVPTGVLRAAQFKALDSFRKHSAEEFDTLFELAASAPQEFGVSVSIFQSLAWKMADGTEVLTDCWSPRPPDATSEPPLIRPTSIESADFVSAPAANKALFSREKALAPAYPKTHDSNSQPATHLNAMTIITALQRKYGANPKHLAKAIQFAADNPEAKAEDIIAKTDLAISDEEAAAMVAENEKLKTDNAALTTEVETLKAKVAELEGTDTEKVEQMSKITKERDDLKAQVEQLSKGRRYGIPAVDTGKPAGDNDAPEVKGHERVVAAFSKPAAKPGSN